MGKEQLARQALRQLNVISAYEKMSNLEKDLFRCNRLFRTTMELKVYLDHVEKVLKEYKLWDL